MNLKQIVYRGGVINFRIPDIWIEEYEPEGGGTFYEDMPDSGTLRLNLLTFESPNEITTEIIADNFRSSSRGEVAVLPNGNVLRRFVKPVSEDGEELIIYNWEIGNPVTPKNVRIAVFSYTILASAINNPKVIEEVALLDSEMMNAKFASILGE